MRRTPLITCGDQQTKLFWTHHPKTNNRHFHGKQSSTKLKPLDQIHNLDCIEKLITWLLIQKDKWWSFRIYLRKTKRKSFFPQLLYSMKYKFWYVQMIVKGIVYTSPVSTEDSHHSNVSIRMPLPKHGSSLSHAYEDIIHISLGNFYFGQGCERRRDNILHCHSCIFFKCVSLYIYI